MKGQKVTDFKPPDGGYGWVIVGANIISNACLLVLVQCFGIIFQKEFYYMGITAARTSFLLHLHNSLFCLLGLLTSPFLKKYTFRHVAFFGATLMSVGILLTAFASSYAALIFTVSILVGAGQGILMPALYLATNTYFKKRLTLAMSFAVTGGSVSLIFMPQLCNLLLERYGVKYTILTLFAVSLHAFPCCFLLKPPATSRKASANGNIEMEAADTLLKETVYQETTLPKNEEGVFNRLVNVFDLELLTQKSYVLIIVGMGVSFVSELNIVLMVPFVLAELSGFNREQIADFQSVHYAADFVGRLAVPLVAHKFGWSPKLMYAAALIGSSLGRLGLVIFSDISPLLIYGVSVVLGASKGAKAVFQSLIIPKYVSLEKLPAATGLSMVLNGILSLIIGPLIGLAHDISNSYSYTLHVASLLSISCVVLWVVEALLKRTTKELSVEAS